MSAHQPARLPPFTGGFCNLLALQRGLHPAGHTNSFDNLRLQETPAAWRCEQYQATGALTC